MNDVPTLKEEVERKAIETLEKLAVDLDLGRINEAQYAYGLDILWSASAGIAGEDFKAMMEVARPVKKSAARFTREYYRTPNGERLAKITNTHEGVVMVEVGKNDGELQRQVFDFRQEPNPAQLAKQKFQALGDTLVARDFNPF